jgi:hypothetical protein
VDRDPDLASGLEVEVQAEIEVRVELQMQVEIEVGMERELLIGGYCNVDAWNRAGWSFHYRYRLRILTRRIPMARYGLVVAPGQPKLLASLSK